MTSSWREWIQFAIHKTRKHTASVPIAPMVALPTIDLACDEQRQRVDTHSIFVGGLLAYDGIEEPLLGFVCPLRRRQIQFIALWE